MLIFLSQMVNRFTEEYLDMVVQVNLTVMLVLATLWVLFGNILKNVNVSVFSESARLSQPPPTSS